MNILIDVGHPAHVHIFRNFAQIMEDKEHNVLFTCRDKEFIIQLLNEYRLKYVSLGKKYNSLITKAIGLIDFDLKLLSIARKFKPDIFLSAGSMYAAQVSSLLRKPHITFEDTYNKEQVWLYEPFTEMVLTGNYEHPTISKKEIHIAGYNELAYLYPGRFIPDNGVLQELGIKEGEKYIIMRFVAMNATHDLGKQEVSMENKIKGVEELSRYAKVFISSEKELPRELKGYKLPTAPQKIHSAIAYSSLYLGESSTMAEEAAMLAVPSIELLTKGTWYTRHLQNDYGLVKNFPLTIDGWGAAVTYATELLQASNAAEIFKSRYEKMINERIDVTAFLVWLVENYPESARIMKENPNYQYNFK